MDSFLRAEELDLNASFALGTFDTVFQAEVYCLRECMTSKTICICSDSWAALLALSSHTVSSRLVLQCIIVLSIHNRVKLFWVSGYCGIFENEDTDGLARKGAKNNFCGPEPCLPVPKSL
jgi:ribonuclease HI